MPDLGFSTVRETAWLYIIVIGVAGAGILFSLYAGTHLPRPAVSSLHSAVAQDSIHRADAMRSSSSSAMAGLAHNATSALSHLFVQLGIIISASPARWAGPLRDADSLPWWAK